MSKLDDYLEERIKDLRKPFYQKPSMIISMLSMMIAAAGLFIAYDKSNEAEEAKSDLEKIEGKIELLNEEKTRLIAEEVVQSNNLKKAETKLESLQETYNESKEKLEETDKQYEKSVLQLQSLELEKRNNLVYISGLKKQKRDLVTEIQRLNRELEKGERLSVDVMVRLISPKLEITGREIWNVVSPRVYKAYIQYPDGFKETLEKEVESVWYFLDGVTLKNGVDGRLEPKYPKKNGNYWVGSYIGSSISKNPVAKVKFKGDPREYDVPFNYENK